METSKYEKFTWTIQNFSKLNTRKFYSEQFIIGGHPWRLLLYPNGNNLDQLSLYLDVADAANLPYGWTRFANFRLILINQHCRTSSITKETEHHFNARESDWGFSSFVPLNKFHDPKKGFLVNGTCIMEVEVSVPRAEDRNQVKQEPIAKQESNVTPSAPAAELTDCHANPSLPEVTKKVVPAGVGDSIDFHDLEVEDTFVPFLEEVCSCHPSLIKSQQKRSQAFAKWAFTALGRVLHFLETTKMKDMNEEAQEHLQVLWEELEAFKFDMAWLEPHVRSILSTDMKTYLEKAEQVKKLKENVAALEKEMKKLKARLSDVEVDLAVAKRDFAKAGEDFQDIELDSFLGYGNLF